jgi:hypothetical protein
MRVLCICPFHMLDYVATARKCFESQIWTERIWMEWDTSGVLLSVGEIRNAMIERALREGRQFDAIAHFDHDDWSSPWRLAEQAAVLFLNPTVDVVGYHDMPFYDSDTDKVKWFSFNKHDGMGTSLLYRLSAWQRTPFPDKRTGEDHAWLRNHKANLVTQSSVVGAELRMWARIHSRNTSGKTGPRFKPASPEIERMVRETL